MNPAQGQEVIEARDHAPDGGRGAAVDWIVVVADPVRLHILRVLSQAPEATAADLASSGSMSGQTVRRHLDALVALGVIETQVGASDGQTPGRPPARFSMPMAVRQSVARAVGASRVRAGEGDFSRNGR